PNAPSPESSTSSRSNRLRPGEAVPVRRPSALRRLEPRVRLLRLGRLLLRARAVARRKLRHRVKDLLVRAPGAGHENHARPVAGADEDVVGAGWAVDEVPRSEGSLLPVHEQRAFARKDEEGFLLRLRVVQATRLPRLDDADVDPELRERELPGIEVGSGAERLRHPPLRVAGVDHEPALARGREPRAGVFE